MIEILPSILAADFARLAEEIERVEQEIGRANHYATTRHTFQIYGICEECRKKNQVQRA